MIFLFLLSAFCFLLSAEAGAAVRLGLHVTQEELNIWRQRRTDNVTGINGFTFQNIYNSRILADANTFKAAAHPSVSTDGRWAGYTGAGCIPGGQSIVPGRGNGLQLMKSAFHFLLTGDATYANPVRTELVAQVAAAGTAWSNSSKWCLYDGTTNHIYDANAFETIPWLLRLLFAYDYLLAGGYTGFSAGEITTINQWFLDAGLVWDSVTTGTITFNIMPGAFNEPADFTCGGCSAGGGPLLYFGGPTAAAWHGVFNNRMGAAGAASAIIGVFTNNATLKAHGKRFFEANIRFGAYSAGQVYDISRWGDCSDATPCPRSAWGHAAGTWSGLAGAADMLARAGDSFLYTYTAPAGLHGSDGNNIRTLDIMREMARMANSTSVRYGTTVSGSQNFAHQITWNSDGHSYWDFVGAVANLWYQNSEITTAMARNLAAGVNTCTDNQYGCFNGLYVSWPDIPFMFGNMEGAVNPYVFGQERFVDNSTTATSTCINGSQTYNPSTRSCGSGTSTVYVSGDPIKAALAATPAMGGGDTLWLRGAGGSGGGTYSDGNPVMRNGSSSTSRFVMSGYLNEIPDLRPTSAPIAYGGIYFAAGAQWATAKNLRILLNAPQLAGQGCRGIIWEGQSGGGIQDGLVVENIEIDGTGNVCNGSGGLMWLTGSGNNQVCPNCKLINMHIHHVGEVADSGGNQGHAIRIMGQGVEVVGGSYHHAGNYCVLFYGGEPVTATAGYGPTNITIRNVTAYNCPSAGIAYLPWTTPTHKVDIYNNVVYNSGAGIVANSLDSSSKIYSNTIYNSGNGIWLGGAASNTEVRNNRLISGTPLNINTSVIQTNNTTTGTAGQFAEAANGDFHLCTGPQVPHKNCTTPAPDLNNGFNLGSPWNQDKEGTSRPQGSGYATGAYEEGAGGSVTPTPLQFALKLPCDGNVNDTSGNGNSGSLVAGATASAAGKYNQGCSFNGTTAHIQISDSNSLDMQGGFTVAAWVKATSAPPAGYQLVLAKENSPSTDGSYYLAASGSTGSCPSGSIFGGYLQGGASILACQAVPLDTNWTHLAVTYDAASPAEVLLYRGGLPVNNVPGGATLTPGTGHLFIGSGGTAAGTGNFNGMIDEVWIFKGKLPATGGFDSDCTTNASDPNSWSINRVMNCSINPVTPTPGAPTGVKVGGAGSVKIGGGGIVRMGQ